MRNLNGSLLRIVPLFTLAIVWTTSDASAQSKSLFGSSSILSSGSSSSATTMGTGTFGSSLGTTAGTGSMTSGLGTTGNSLGASGGYTFGSASTTTGFNQQGMVGSTNRAGSTQGRFLGAAATSGQGQLGLGGQNRAGMNQLGLGATGQAGRGNTGRGRNANQNQNMQGLNQAGRTTRAGNVKTTLRPQQRVAFDYAPPTEATTQRSLQAQFSGERSGASLKGVDVNLENGVAVLRGSVDSDESRKLAAIMARLEPGVSKVRDELVVPPTAK